MTVTLAPETETRLRTMAEGFGLEPAELHEELLQRALAKAEAEFSKMLECGQASYPPGNLNRPAE